MLIEEKKKLQVQLKHIARTKTKQILGLFELSISTNLAEKGTQL